MVEFRWRNRHPSGSILLASGKELKPNQTVWMGREHAMRHHKGVVLAGWLCEDSETDTCDCCGHSRRSLITREV